MALKADLPQGGQVLQPLADAEVARVVDRGLRPQRPPFLVVLFDPGAFVVDVQGGDDALGEHPRAKTARSPLTDAPLEDQLHLVWRPEVQVLADHLLEEDPPADGAGPAPGSARTPPGGSRARSDSPPARSSGVKGCGRRASHFRNKRVDLVPPRAGRPDRLASAAEHRTTRCRCPTPRRQSPHASNCRFSVLVAVEAELGRVGKVGTELEKEGAEVLVHAVEVVVVDHRRGADDPGIGLARVGDCGVSRCGRPASSPGLCPRRAPLLPAENARQVLRGDVVLALLLLERDQRNLLVLAEAGDRCRGMPC